MGPLNSIRMGADGGSGSGSLTHNQAQAMLDLTFCQTRSCTQQGEHRPPLDDQAYRGGGDAQEQEEAKDVRYRGHNHGGCNGRIKADPSQQQGNTARTEPEMIMLPAIVDSNPYPD